MLRDLIAKKTSDLKEEMASEIQSALGKIAEVIAITRLRNPERTMYQIKTSEFNLKLYKSSELKAILNERLESENIYCVEYEESFLIYDLTQYIVTLLSKIKSKVSASTPSWGFDLRIELGIGRHTLIPFACSVIANFLNISLKDMGIECKGKETAVDCCSFSVHHGITATYHGPAPTMPAVSAPEPTPVVVSAFATAMHTTSPSRLRL